MFLNTKALEDAVDAMRGVLKSIDGAYAVFVGGLAVRHYGSKSSAFNVGAVVDRLHFGSVTKEMLKCSFVLDPNYFFIHKESGTRMDLLKEGMRMQHSTNDLPHPSALGKNGWFCDLPALIFLKLESNRLQDLADIVALMRTNAEKKDAILGALPEAFHGRFVALADQAQVEIEAARENGKATYGDIESFNSNS